MEDRTLFLENGPRAILLFHALTSTPNDFRAFAKGLERAGYTVYAPTLSGHGTENPDDLFEHGIESWKQDGEEAYQFLKEKGYDEIATFGLSLGGIVATHVMLNQNVKGAGVFSSPVVNNENSKSNVPENFLEWYEQMKKKQGKTEQEISGLKTAAEPKLETLLNNVNNYVKQMSSQYSEVDMPVFIAQGEKDEMIDPHLTGEYRDALTKAEVDFHWYDNAPHVITTGKIGKELQVDLLSFLSTLDWTEENNE